MKYTDDQIHHALVAPSQKVYTESTYTLDDKIDRLKGESNRNQAKLIYNWILQKHITVQELEAIINSIR